MNIKAVIVDELPGSLDSCPLKRHVTYHTNISGMPVITVDCGLFENETTVKFFGTTTSRCVFCPLIEEYKMEKK